MENESRGQCFDPRVKGYEDEDPLQLVRKNIVTFCKLISDISKKDWDPEGSCLRRLENFTKNDRNLAIERISGFGYKRTGSEKFFQGLIPRLRRNLWPWNDGDPKNNRKRITPPGSKSKYWSVTGIRRSCPTYGNLHGTIVSQEMEACMKAIDKNEDLDLKSADPCTARILDCLLAANWIPMATELPVWDEKENVATALDLLVVDIERAKIIAIEIKTGYENEEYGPLEQDPPLLEPFPWLRDCPEHRHDLQLASTVYLLEKGHEDYVDEAWVLQACSKMRRVGLFESPEWLERVEAKQWIEQALVK